MTGESSDEHFRSHRPEIFEYPRQCERHNPGDPSHVDRIDVVADQHRTVLSGTPPERLLAETQLPVGEIPSHISIEQVHTIYLRSGSSRRQWQDRSNSVSHRRSRRVGQRWSTWRVLVFTSNVEGKRADFCMR